MKHLRSNYPPGRWLLLLLALPACTPLRQPPDAGPGTGESTQARESEALDVEARPRVPDAGRRSFTILAVNDVYRIEGIDDGRYGGLARLRTLRAELEREHPDLLFLHAGDLLFPSLLSRLYKGGHMIDMLNRLDGGDDFDPRMFVTFGNHEFDKAKLKDAAMLRGRVEESDFHWLGTNIVFKSDDHGLPLVEAENLIDSTIIDSGGVRVGLFGLSTDEKHPAYVHSFNEPKAVARRITAELRERGAEVVVALTHLSIAQDVDLLCKLGDAGPDLVIGGHEHNKQSDDRCGRWVVKADAEARTATVMRVTLEGQSPPEIEFEYRELGPDAGADPEVAARVESWFERFREDYCGGRGEPPGCLDAVAGRTHVRLDGEELEIRRFETNLGDWILDQALSRFRDQGARAAFINSGSLRLNRDIPAGDVTMRDIEEIFQYPSELKLLRLKGSVLQQVVSHAVTGWSGSGKWLQVSGFAFRHDPATANADRLTLLSGPDGPLPVDPEEDILVVTNDFLATPGTGQDGYTMLTENMLVPYAGEPATLRELVIGGLEAAGPAGISPVVEGRICNTEREGPCLAVASGDLP